MSAAEVVAFVLLVVAVLVGIATAVGLAVCTLADVLLSRSCDGFGTVLAVGFSVLILAVLLSAARGKSGG